MKYCKLVFLQYIFLLLSLTTSAQVFISEYYEGEVFVGPENVMSINEQIKNAYIEDLSKIVGEFQSQIEEIERLSNAKKKSKEDRSRLKELKRFSKDIAHDQEYFEALLEVWKDYEVIEFQEGEDYCFFNSTDGSFREVSVEKSTTQKMMVYEYMPMIEMPNGMKWTLKDRDENCLSKDPKECRTWLLSERISPGFIDVTNKQMPLDTITDQYFDFRIAGQNSLLIRSIEYEFATEESLFQFYNLSKTDRIPSSWIVKCE